MKSILHIEDHSDFRDNFREIFENYGFTVISCSDSRHAWDYLPLKDYSCVVVDNSGFDYCRKLSRILRRVFVAVLSSSPDKADFPANLVLGKLDTEWPGKLFDAMRSFAPLLEPVECLDSTNIVRQGATRMTELPRIPAERIDAVAAYYELSEETQKELAGTVLIVSITQNRIVHYARSILEAKEWIKSSPHSGDWWRLVDAPPVTPYTLQEIEDS